MKLLARVAAAAVALGTGCADIPATNDPPVRTRAAANNALPTTPGVEAPKVTVSPSASMSTGPGMDIPTDRDPPDRIPVSR
jgi:hypothetical protein